MKRKATAAGQSSSKTPAKACDKQQQRLLQTFIGKPILEDCDNRFKSILPSLSPLTRVVSGTEGTDGDAFTALMTAVAARKPLMVFSLTLFEGKLLPEIKLNSDPVKTNSESATLNDNFDNKTSLETVPTDVDEIAQRKPDIITPKKGTRSLCSLSDADGWDRECRLPNFSFSVHPGSSDRSAPDVDLTICTNIPPKANAPEDRCDRFPIHHTILKSMLQKAVRRRITESVIRLSLALAHVSTLELLRRLPIICLEDGALHPAFPVLVWCMIASSKGYLLPDFLLSVCVHIIAEISDTRHMDSLWSQTDSRHSKDLSDSIPVRPTSVAAQTSASEDMNEVRPCRSTTYDIRHQPVSSARTLVLSIMLRTAFGGMAGDMKMLREYAAQWYGRFFLQANNLSSNPCNFSCPTSICLSTSISTLSRPLISRGATGFSCSYSESSVAMSSYLHPQWMESTMGFLWGWQCIMAYAISDPDDRTIPAINANVVSSAFLLLRNCISANLLHNSKLSLALYSPAAPQGSLSIAGKNAYQALRLTPKDLVSEGIDFHCDGEIVKAVFDRCSPKVIALLTILRESNSDDSRVRNEGKQAIDSHFISLKKDSTQKAEATSSPPFSVTKVEDIIKSTIWLFRSSVNMHKVWSPPMHVSEAGVVSEPLVVGMHADTGIQQLGIESNIAQENSPKTEQLELLQRKQKLAPFWGIICPAVKVHCEVKRLELEVKLARFLRDTCNN